MDTSLSGGATWSRNSSLPNSGQTASTFVFLRSLLTQQSKAVGQVEFWTSQIQATKRVLDPEDNLVVSLPTSAGKTRIAEVAALRTIAAGKRVVLVTPLRALSAQMEDDFQDLFGALGQSVSSLYGAAGVLYGDLDALRLAKIVITTPEKLDAAMRVDPGLLDDVGLIALDEGHMVGFDARGLRYETLIQRLLNRPDASGRQLLCLSAVFPSGPAFEDFVAWLRKGVPGGPLTSDWRPTRQRFASLAWAPNKASAKLVYEGNEDAWVDPMLVGTKTGPKKNSKLFPSSQGELTIAAAWRFAAGGSVLVYSTQPNFVETLAKCAITGMEKGWLSPLEFDDQAFAHAAEVGKEWLGAEHVAVKALSYGFVVHHGGLPQPFRREAEGLLKQRCARVAIASPTLAQGVNLAASTLLFHAITRGSSPIEAREFANVAGRAGRAFVDVEGLVVRPMFTPKTQRRPWRKLLKSLDERSLTSGLADGVAILMDEIAPTGPAELDQFIEYLANQDKAWISDELEFGPVLDHIDHALISLLDPLDASEGDLPKLIDEALKGSLFNLTVDRLTPKRAAKQRGLLEGRARYIWRRSSPEA